ncbi:MAG: hypothetical protein ACT4PL_00635 [Phycisphaerales bacterium]
MDAQRDHDPVRPSVSPVRPVNSPAACALVAAVVVLLVGWGYILSGHRSGAGPDDTAVRAVFDQELFHLRVVRTFAAQWPGPDLHDYRSATTPLIHLMLAGLDRAAAWVTGTSADADGEGLSRTGLRMANALFAVGLAWTLARVVGRRARPAACAAIVLPVLCSSYFFSSAAYLLPDNAAWWGVLGILALAVFERVNVAWYVLGGSVLVLLVLTRQVHLWAAAPLVMAAWLGRGGEPVPGPVDPLDRTYGLLPPMGERGAAVARAAVAVAVCAPAAMMLAIFVREWGGLTPPAFSPGGSALTDKDCTNVSGISLVSPGYVLAVLGLYGVFYLPLNWSILRARARPGCVVVGLLAGLVVAGLGPSTFLLPERIGGLFSVARVLHDTLGVPTLLGRSPVVLLPATFGGGLLALVLGALPRRDAWIMFVALAAFAAAQAAGALTWLRYIEPMVLVWLVLASARLAEDRRGSAAAMLPLWLLAGALAAISAVSVLG